MAKRDKYQNEFEKIKPSVLDRDKNKCVKCGAVLSLEVHHIEGYKNNDPKNLATLCYLCHGIAPMGKGLFEQWLVLGESGVDMISRELKGRGFPKLNRDQILEFCGVLLLFNLDANKQRMKKAIDRLIEAGEYRPGRHTYGMKNGEAVILERMRKMRREGLEYYKIADELNAQGVPCRMGLTGKIWKANTIQKILTRRKSAEKA